MTLANVNQRAQPNTSSAIVTTVPAGFGVALECWTEGQNINGDNIWYMTDLEVADLPAPRGYIAGYYLDTGHDPIGGLVHC